MNEGVVIDLRKMGDAAAAAVGGQQRRRRPPPLVALERRHALVRRVRQPEHVAILRRLRLEPPQRARPQLAAAEQEAHEHGAADVLPADPAVADRVAPREVALDFAVESVYAPRPFGVHAAYKWLSSEQMAELLEAIDYS